MADQKKQPTHEEIEAQRKKDISSLEANLKNDFYSNVLGSNTLRNEDSFYGSFAKNVGESQYLAAMKSEGASKLRENIHNEAMSQEEKARADLGIADMPDVPYPTNYQVAKYVLSIMRESIGGLPLGNLEKLLGSTAKGAKLEIPNELKQYETQREALLQQAQETNIDPKEVAKMLDKDSEDALQMYKSLVYEAFKRGAAYKLLESHKYDDINNTAKKFADSYRKAKGIKEPVKEEPKKKAA